MHSTLQPAAREDVMGVKGPRYR